MLRGETLLWDRNNAYHWCYNFMRLKWRRLFNSLWLRSRTICHAKWCTMTFSKLYSRDYQYRYLVGYSCKEEMTWCMLLFKRSPSIYHSHHLLHHLIIFFLQVTLPGRFIVPKHSCWCGTVHILYVDREDRVITCIMNE